MGDACLTEDEKYSSNMRGLIKHKRDDEKLISSPSWSSLGIFIIYLVRGVILFQVVQHIPLLDNGSATLAHAGNGDRVIGEWCGVSVPAIVKLALLHINVIGSNKIM